MSKRAADIRFIWPATAILLLAAALRLALLAEAPPGLSQDEVLNADIVKFILGGEHALFFRHGFGHEPLYHYFATPFQLALGDNVLAIRLPAAFLGLLLVAITMRWAKRDYGALAGLVAGLGLAVSWWAIIFSRVGIRPILEAVLLVAAAWAWPRRPWLAGVLLGLSIYSYTAARYIFLLPLGMVLYLIVFHRRGQRLKRGAAYSWRSIRGAIIVLVVSLAFYAPLAITLWANPALQQRVDQLSGPLDALRQGDVGPVLEMTAATLGVFSFEGDPRWTYSIPGRPVFDVLTSAFFVLGAVVVLWRWRRPTYGLLIVWFGLTLLPSALSPDAPSTIRLIGLMPVAFVFLGIGAEWLWAHWSRRLDAAGQGRRALKALPWLLLVIILSVNLGRTIEGGFVTWPAALETRLKYQSVLQEMGKRWEKQGRPRLVVVDSFFEPIDADSLRRNLGYDPGARWVQAGQDTAGAMVIPAGGGTARVYIPEYAPLPLALFQAAGLDQSPSYRSDGHPAFAVHEFNGRPASPQQAAGVSLEGKIMFMGHTMLALDEREIRLVTFWEVQDALPDDLAAFVHLVNQEGEIVAQYDGLDAAAGTLRSGDVIIQHHVLTRDEGIHGGPFALRVGMYRRGDGSRLMAEETGLDHIIIEREVLLTND